MYAAHQKRVAHLHAPPTTGTPLFVIVDFGQSKDLIQYTDYLLSLRETVINYEHAMFTCTVVKNVVAPPFLESRRELYYKDI